MPSTIKEMRDILNKLPSSQRWRLFIDGYRQNEGRLAFDARENGYMAGMENAFDEMQRTINKPLSSEMIIELHRHALFGVENTDNEQLDTFRNGSPGDFGLMSNEDAETPKKGNASRKGVMEFLLSGALRETITSPSGKVIPKYQIEYGGKDISRDNSPEDVYDMIKSGRARFYVARQSAEGITQDVRKTLQNYNLELTRARTPDEKQNAIIKMVSSLERAHIFTDGNARTMVMLVLNRELVRNGFTPVILENPNRFDLFSIEELKTEVSVGMQHYWHYANKEEIVSLLRSKGLHADLADPLSPPPDSGYASQTASPAATLKEVKKALHEIKDEGHQPAADVEFQSDSDIDIDGQNSSGKYSPMDP